MKHMPLLFFAVSAVLAAGAGLPVASAAPTEHPGKSFIEQNGYDGPQACENCRSEVSVLDFGRLGYSSREIHKLTSPSNYFDKYAAIKAEENEDF